MDSLRGSPIQIETTMRLKEGVRLMADWMNRHQMVQPGDCVWVALSGGADSVCLLRLLLKQKDAMQLTIRAVHVNHHLRGAESKRDAAFCRALCAQWHVPFTLLERDVQAYAVAQHCSIETAARVCRYEAFAACLSDGEKLATAHTASDNLETAVHRLIRGGGLQGMSGISPVRSFFIRPLLGFTRQDIESMLEELQQPFVTDSSNLTDDYTRNRIRHQIVPQMRQLNPSVERTSVHTLSALQMENEFVTMQAEQAYTTCHSAPHVLTGLSNLHPALQMRCLARFLQEHDLPYDGKRLEQLQALLHRDGKQNLSGTVYCVAKQGTLSIEQLDLQDASVRPVPLQWGWNQIYPNLRLEARLIEDENYVKCLIVHKKFANLCVDYDKIKGTVILRGRIYGDRIQLVGCNFTSSVKKRIQEKVPQNRRKTLHFLEDEEGLFYAEQIGMAQRVAPDVATKRLLFLVVQACQSTACTTNDSNGTERME